MGSVSSLSSISTVMEIELCIDRCLAIWRQKRTNSVNELAMKPKGVRSSSSVKSIIQLPTHRSHCKGIVVVANVPAKVLPIMLLGSQQLQELRRWMLERREGDFALKATGAKPGIAM
jgi:hypothetical protein